MIDVRDSDFVGGHIKGARNIGAQLGGGRSQKQPFVRLPRHTWLLGTAAHTPTPCHPPSLAPSPPSPSRAVSETFNDDSKVDKVLEAHCGGADTVVVHCYLSQVRGPFCAQR